MKRATRLVFLSLLGATLLLAAEAIRERFTPPHDLRDFDAAAVGKLDTEMWRSYYERRQVLLLRQLLTLLSRQFGMPPLEAVRNAYRAAHAAFVFKDGKSRVDYERALPDLQAYYADVSARATRPFDANRAASLELEWWIQHRERSPQLARGLAELQAALYAVPPEKFEEHARLRADAMALRDDRGTAVTEQDWNKIGEMLNESWRSLHAAVHNK
ncbi:MAG: hypothetical protein ABI811_21815 [Acidobacteriota bacterium]